MFLNIQRSGIRTAGVLCSHTMTVTKEVLLKLYDHTLELRVWDTKDKCSTRARFDRPKAFRLPQPKPGESLTQPCY